jgi:hypothetical protein
MVIVLTGTQAINKKFLSRLFLASLNRYEYKGFYADFSDQNFEIYDSRTNELVYKPGDDSQPGVSILPVKDPSIVDYFQAVNDEIFETGIKHNHFVNIFCSLDVEYGLTSKPAYIRRNGSLLKHPHKFTDVIENINRSPYDVKVITGTFGTHFIDRLRASLPNEEVKVVSIIRNPSVSWLMNKKPETKWLTEINPDLTEDIDYTRFFESTLNAIELLKRRDVTTIKFEDIMKTGKIKFDDIEIDVRDDFKSSNDWINTYEKSIEILMDDEEFKPFNDLLTNYTFEDFHEEDEYYDIEVIYKKPRAKIIEIARKPFPKNVFKELGYFPIDKETILK